ncbi:hypothetical protein Glove_117g244 [Diversispora epigaea]|uniref:TLDc domain-containing protein n=1 Tax=Diversispora epigaea TaxID=1348612 RepID=A0A397J4P7_9GLOM|nr:hypothetical protein Glove_117g244 [Diversispora epigaea]
MVKETDEILGGYNPLAWSNSHTFRSRYKKTKDSFIFSLKNGNIQHSILSKVRNRKNAILNIRQILQNEFGPNFGFDFFLQSFDYNDFTLDNVCCCKHANYEKPIRESSSKYSSIAEYEVFKIVRKS